MQRDIVTERSDDFRFSAPPESGFAVRVLSATSWRRESGPIRLPPEHMSSCVPIDIHCLTAVSFHPQWRLDSIRSRLVSGHDSPSPPPSPAGRGGIHRRFLRTP